MGSTAEEIARERAEHATDKYYGDTFVPWEGPQHRVRITRPYYMGTYLVTQAQYEQITGHNPSTFANDAYSASARGMVADDDTQSFPVESLTWDEAVTFCQTLSALSEEQTAHRVYRLPTEAEWEYACRCGTTTARFYQADDINRYAWFIDNSGKKPHQVGRKAPNAWGLFDMYGNVWQLCSDWYGRDYYQHSPLDDPLGPVDGQGRVKRGGCWGWYSCYCRSALRMSRTQNSSGTEGAGEGSGQGFRIVCEIAPYGSPGATPGLATPFPAIAGPIATLRGLTAPVALAVSSSGDLYVANYSANTVSRFAPGSTLPTVTLTGLHFPRLGLRHQRRTCTWPTSSAARSASSRPAAPRPTSRSPESAALRLFSLTARATCTLLTPGQIR